MFSVKYIIQHEVFRDYVQAGGPGQARGKHPQYHRAGVKRPGRVLGFCNLLTISLKPFPNSHHHTHQQYQKDLSLY
jgi:hypothetical protein